MFGQNKGKIVIECYRTRELSPSFEINQKTTRKIQKDVLQKSASISPRNYDIISAYTDPIKTHENTTDPYKYQRNHRIKKKGRKVIYDLCECHDDGTVNNGKYRPKTWESITKWYGNADTTEVWPVPENQIEIDEDDRPHKITNKTHKKRKSKTHKKRDHHYKQQQSNLNSRNPTALDTSVISLYRKKNTGPGTSLKDTGKKIVPEIISFREKCPQGPCALAEAMENKNFLCRCINRKRGPILTQDCTDSTCEFSRKHSINGVGKLKDNILCLCRKYSQNFLNKKSRNNIQNNHTDSTSNENAKKALRNNHIEIKKAHESEQTGGAFFEVQVSSRDMCVLNPMEIKENIIKYGTSGKREPSCICPSRGMLRPGEVCKGGVCKKAYKNKQVNFNCWCDKKIAECGDATCNSINLRNTDMKMKKTKHVSFQKANKPLLEVQLDMDKMCVVNPKEIEEKIMNNVSPDEICSSGICRNAALNRKIPFLCKCISRKLHSEVTECSGDNCKDITKKKRSKFCLFCTRICSKSENWPYQKRDQTRVRRRSFYEIGPHKLCKGKLCTQSDNLFKKRAVYSNNIDLKHLPTCDCQECKGLKNPVLKRQTGKDIRNISQKNTPAVKKKKEVNDNDRRKEKLITSSRKDKLRNNANKKNNANKRKKSTVTSKELNNEVDDIKTLKKKAKEQEKLEKQKVQNKKKDLIKFNKELKQRTKLDRKNEIKSAKERRRAIKLMQKKLNEEPLNTNFCTACLYGVLKLGLKGILFVFYIIYRIIKNPKKCYWYIRDRIRDPEGTYKKIKNLLKDALLIKKLEISETIRGSDTLTILADHFMDTPFYQTFADQGKTKNEQMVFEQKNKARKRRIRKREQHALHSCRHMLLTTLRQTPCLWVYHICPEFYPQCLSLLAFMRSFSRILLFLVAFACWTPCILSFELCRACLCCFMCTG